VIFVCCLGVVLLPCKSELFLESKASVGENNPGEFIRKTFRQNEVREGHKE
jgi:hypothetical protein